MYFRKIFEQVLNESEIGNKQQIDNEGKIKTILLKNRGDFSYKIDVISDKTIKLLSKKYKPEHTSSPFNIGDNTFGIQDNKKTKYYFFMSYYYFEEGDQPMDWGKVGFDLYEFDPGVPSYNDVDKEKQFPTYYDENLKLLKVYHLDFENKDSYGKFMSQYMITGKSRNPGFKTYEKKVLRKLKSKGI